MSKDSSSPESTILKGNKNLFKWSINPVENASFGSVWQIILNVLLIFIVSQAIAVFIVELLMGVMGRPSSSLDNSPGLQFIYVFLAEVLALSAVYLIIRRRGLGLGSIGLGRRPKLQDLWRGLIGFAAFYGLLIIAGIILSAIFPDFNKGNQDVGFNNLHGTLSIVVAFIALVILPPLGEEPLVRGYLYSGLRSKMRFVPAMLITSFLFGAAHLESGTTASLLWAAGIDTFVLSLILVYLREKSGALYAGMLVHMLNNAVAFGVHFHGIVF